MNLATISNPCGCEPCPTDLGDSRWKTNWEDPAFAGKQCRWHLHIEGSRGCISPDVLDGSSAIFVQLYDKSDRKPLSEVEFTVPASDLNKWAKRIGAKTK